MQSIYTSSVRDKSVSRCNRNIAKETRNLIFPRKIQYESSKQLFLPISHRPDHIPMQSSSTATFRPPSPPVHLSFAPAYKDSLRHRSSSDTPNEKTTKNKSVRNVQEARVYVNVASLNTEITLRLLGFYLAALHVHVRFEWSLLPLIDFISGAPETVYKRTRTDPA